MGVTEEAVDKLMDKTGISSEIAEKTIELTNSNIESAEKLIESKIIVVKGLLRSKNQKICGLFLIELYLKNLFLRPDFVIFREEFQVNKTVLKKGWKKFENYITENKKRDSIIIEHSKEFNNGIMNFIDFERNEYNVEENEIDRIKIKLKNDIIRYIKEELNDTEVEFEFEIETLSQAELEIKESEKKKKNEPSEEDEKIDKKSNDVILKSEPVIDHVKGKSVENLYIGERIMIKIVSVNTESSYIVNSFNMLNKDRKKTNIVPGTVIGIDLSNGDKINIDIQIVPGVLSNFVLKKGMKIKLYREKRRDKRIIDKIFAGVILILALAVLFYFLFIKMR